MSLNIKSVTMLIGLTFISLSMTGAITATSLKAQTCTPINETTSKKISVLGFALTALDHCPNLTYKKEQIHRLLQTFYCSQKNLENMNKVLPKILTMSRERFAGEEKEKLCKSFERLKFPK